MSWAVGDPYNPALVPSALTGYPQTMDFYQRFINTLVVGIFYLVRYIQRFKIIRKTETEKNSEIGMHFPKFTVSSRKNFQMKMFLI